MSPFSHLSHQVKEVMEWWSDGVIVIVIVLFIARYSPEGGIGLNTTKVWTLTNEMQNDAYHRPHTINKKIYNVYYSCESRIYFLFLNIKWIYFPIIIDIILFFALSKYLVFSLSLKLL